MLVTFATCWYALNSKFPADTYLQWMKHLLESVNHYYLVIFTDDAGEKMLREHFAPYYFENTDIKIVVKPIEQWYTYKYKSNWIENHKKNTLLNGSINLNTEWTLNMLWSEKVHFVNDARLNQYFPETDFYGWCDIGYFREGKSGTFVSHPKIRALNKNMVYYARVCDMKMLDYLKTIIQTKNEFGLPIQPIPPNQTSIAGGFFIAYHSKIDSWAKMYDEKLNLYFNHTYLVKDDQTIIIDCILTDPKRFELIDEDKIDPHNKLNHWFQFRRFLS